MDDKELFIKAVEKALSKGWKILGDENCLELCVWNINSDLDFVVREREYPDEGIAIYSLYEVIFNIDFAKAFFGENSLTYLPLNWTRQKDMKKFDWQDYELVLPAWQYHLKLMVIEENPLQYLGQFLNPLPEKEEE